mmetsp:Transcript_18631/g.13516  ORF Transcript_18631/g.13516 Transcript_18631/m.13516 type:complete len:108 (+) Transcript_18631:1178-1501(+)
MPLNKTLFFDTLVELTKHQDWLLNSFVATHQWKDELKILDIGSGPAINGIATFLDELQKKDIKYSLIPSDIDVKHLEYQLKHPNVKAAMYLDMNRLEVLDKRLKEDP